MAKEKNENNETPVQPAKNTEKELQDALEALKNEYAALGKTLEDTKAELNARNDSYVRITAEYENYRKRTAAEKAATYAEAYAGAAELFLPMADALERASELAPEDKGVDALICGGIGGGAQTALAQAGIRLYGGVSGGADEAVRALLDGRLAYDPDVRCGHHDHAHGEESHTCGAHGCGHGCKTDS